MKSSISRSAPWLFTTAERDKDEVVAIPRR